MTCCAKRDQLPQSTFLSGNEMLLKCKPDTFKCSSVLAFAKSIQTCLQMERNKIYQKRCWSILFLNAFKHVSVKVLEENCYEK